MSGTRGDRLGEPDQPQTLEFPPLNVGPHDGASFVLARLSGPQPALGAPPARRPEPVTEPIRQQLPPPPPAPEPGPYIEPGPERDAFAAALAAECKAATKAVAEATDDTIENHVPRIIADFLVEIDGYVAARKQAHKDHLDGVEQLLHRRFDLASAHVEQTRSGHGRHHAPRKTAAA